MSQYYYSQLHQVTKRAPKGKKRSVSVLSWSYQIKKLPLSTLSVLAGILFSVFIIVQLMFSVSDYIEGRIRERIGIPQYINELIVPQNAKIEELQDKVNELDVHALDAVYFKKFIPSRHYRIKGGTKEQRARFRSTH